MKKIILAASLFSASLCANAQLSGMLNDIKILRDGVKQLQEQSQQPQQQQQQRDAGVAQPAPVQQRNPPVGAANTQPTSLAMQRENICPVEPENEICEGKKRNSARDESSVTSADLGKFNLKGLHLKMSKLEAVSIIPKLRETKYPPRGGKESVRYSCGKNFTADQNSTCNFTFGGVEILGVAIDYWGNDILNIKLFFNDYRQSDKGNFGAAMKNIQDGLDVKYKEYANGRKNPGDGVWKNWSEGLAFARNTNQHDVLELANLGARKEFRIATESEQRKEVELKERQRIQKTTSDM